MANKPHFDSMKLLRTMTAKRCEVCQKRVKLYRETKYLNPIWRCTGCGRIEEMETEPVKQLEFV